MTKKLASKADLAVLNAQIETRFTQIDRKFTLYFIVLAALIIFLNQNTVEFIIK